MYRFFYKDGSYLDYELGGVDAYKAMNAVMENRKAVQTDIGVLVLDDIRSIIILPELPKDDPNDGLPPGLTTKDRVWITQQRTAAEDKEDDDGVDY